MTTKPEDVNLKVWFAIHRTHDVFKMCEDKVFGEHGFTTEQYSVLIAVKTLNGSARVTDVAHLLTRSVNSVSMIADRMVKAGLLRRVRAKKDRREVRLAVTASADARLGPAVLAGQEFIGEILSQSSSGDKLILIYRLGVVQDKASEYLSSREPAAKGN